MDSNKQIYKDTFELSQAEIMKKYKVSTSFATYIAINKLYNTMFCSKAVIGFKSEAYATESEMLSDKVYTYESLSDSEKKIYDYL